MDCCPHSSRAGQALTGSVDHYWSAASSHYLVLKGQDDAVSQHTLAFHSQSLSNFPSTTQVEHSNHAIPNMKTTYIAGLATALVTSAAAAAQAICEPSDGLSILQWMLACDSVTGGSAAKCADSACHTALHRLEEEETHACWEHLGLGTHDDFHKYEELDAFCHGEGPDPEVTPATASTNATNAASQG